MSLWDEVKDFDAGMSVLVPRPDGSGLAKSGTIIAKDDEAKTLTIVGSDMKTVVLDYSKEPEPEPPKEESDVHA